MPRVRDQIKSLFHSRPKFKYEPLNPGRKEIRVLVFEDISHWWNGKASTTLKCTTTVVSLLNETKPSYHAISYCWGKDPPLRRIILNDEEAWVPESAVKALRTVCHPVHGKRDVPVWIDAICINQADDVEKSHQVAMMSDIYATAAEVLIWIGDEDKTTESGFEAIMALLDADLNGVHVDEHFFSNDADWISLFKFFHSPYFNRLWPVQEICLAKVAVCWRGKFRLPWTSVLAVSKVLEEVNSRTDMFWEYDGYNDLILAFFNQAFISDLPLELILRSCSRFETTDPRDKIYAVSGLLSAQQWPKKSLDLLTPDYSLTTRDVYLRATIASFHSCHSLNVLTSASLGNDDREEDSLILPSWVSRYDLPLEGGGSYIWGPTSGSHGGLAAVFDAEETFMGVLKAQGIVVGEIASINPAIRFITPTERETHKVVEKLAACFEPLWKTQMSPDDCHVLYGSKQIPLTHVMYSRDAETETTGEDKASKEENHEDEIVTEFEAFMALCQDYCEPCTDTSSGRRLQEREAKDGDAERFVKRLCDATWRRRFATTSKGQYVMAPLFTEPGDIVCILFGCEHPLVLRRKGAEYQGRIGEFWQLLGTAYVYGTMEGEHIHMLRNQGRLEEETRWFSLI